MEYKHLTGILEFFWALEMEYFKSYHMSGIMLITVLMKHYFWSEAIAGTPRSKEACSMRLL